jgi:hypothetical protein
MLPERTEELTMPAQKCLWLYNEEGPLPGPNHPGQQHQEKSVSLSEDGSFNLAMQDDELLPQQRVFDKQFGLPFSKVCYRSKHKGRGAWFHPSNKTTIECVKAESYSLSERDENREHRLLLCDEKDGYQSRKDMNAL